MVNFRKITEENFDAIINRKRPEGENLVAPNAVSLAQAWLYRNQKRAWKAADFPGVSLCNVQSTVNKPLNCNLAGRCGNAPWLSPWESCQPNRLTERVPQ